MKGKLIYKIDKEAKCYKEKGEDYEDLYIDLPFEVKYNMTKDRLDKAILKGIDIIVNEYDIDKKYIKYLHMV